MKILFCFLCFVASNVLLGKEAVFLLHGLGDSSFSMKAIENALEKEGYAVYNIDYPSRELSIEDQSDALRSEIIGLSAEYTRIHFITHSLGGILVRRMNEEVVLPKLGRVVMLAPPNNGSNLANTFKDWPGFTQLLGPAFEELSTEQIGDAVSATNVDFELGIIAGNSSNFLPLSWLLEGEDDGIVSVSTTRINNMDDFIVIHASHPLITRHPVAIAQALTFLKNGRFQDVSELDIKTTPGRIAMNRSRNPYARQSVGYKLDWALW